MLVDIIVTKGQKIVAAKPPKNIGNYPSPIILVRTEVGNVLPVIKWNGHESYSWRERLENRTFGRLSHVLHYKRPLELFKHMVHYQKVGNMVA